MEESEPKPIICEKKLSSDEIRVLKIIQRDPYITNSEIASKISHTPNYVSNIIKSLKQFRYIKKEVESKRTSPWILLRDLKDDKTKYSYFNDDITLLFDDSIKC